MNDWINGLQFAERWGFSAVELIEHLKLWELGFPVYDDKLNPSSIDELSMSNLDKKWFRLTDIKENEKRSHEYAVSFLIEQGMEEKEAKESLNEWKQQTDEPLTKSQDNSTNEEENYFRCERDFWKIGYEGKESTIKYSKGLHYIALLLANPYKTISYLELCHAVEPPEGMKIQLREAIDEGLFIAEKSKDVEAINTPETTASLRKEIERLISENGLETDPLIIAETENKIAEIETCLKEGSFENKAYSKTQESVSRAIKRAYEELSDNNMSELVKYLNNNKITLIKKHGYMYSGTSWIIKI